MSELNKRFAELSPDKLALFFKRLREGREGESQRLVISPRTGARSVPLSFAQQRLWFLDQLDPGAPTYIVPTNFHITGKLDTETLRRSLDEIVRRHETLRTSFPVIDEEPIQVIAPSFRLRLNVTDLSDLPGAERDAEVARLAREESRTPFDISTGPLLRGGLLRLGKEEYVLLLTTHHIVSDGWSIGIFFRELAILYEAYSAGYPSPLPELQIQYADYALWQREQMQGDRLEAQLSYWTTHLKGAPAVLGLPMDRPRPSLQSFNGAVESFLWPGGLVEGLKDLSRQEGATLYMTLLATFQSLLHRYSGQQDVLVGAPIATRDRAELEGLIGLLTNTVVLRTSFSGDPSFRDVLRRVKEVALGAYANSDIPFERLVEELQPERDLSHNPLFQVMFILENVPGERPSLAGLSVRPLAGEAKISVFDLTLSVEDGPSGLAGSVQYNTDLFDKATIVRLIGHYRMLLETVVTNPDQAVSKLRLLTDAEREQIVVGRNRTTVEYPDHDCIHRLFEAQVDRSPQAIALVFEQEQLSYDELNQRANRLAHYLQRLGIGPKSLVGLCVEKSTEMVVALLGILKAGGAYVPLDPAYPNDRLAFMQEDSRPPVLLTRKQFAHRFSKSVGRIVCLDSDWESISGCSNQNPASEVKAGDLAYVIYTSGSTGKPKGVMIEHRGLCNLWNAQVRAFGLEASNRVLQFASLSFDASIFEVVMALLTGATLVVARRESLLPGPALIRLLREERITNVTLPPSVLGMLEEVELPELKTIIVAGEACSAELVRRWGKGRRFFNAYGPTETTVWATVAECGVDEGKPSIGRPIDNTRVYVLDENREVAPMGVSGEIYIGGVGLARGYLNREELTAERFIADEISVGEKSGGGRLYRTGDVGRYQGNGEIEYVGRIDHQVKVRGFRIEPGEIEATLGEHPGIRESVVIASGDASDERRLVAYVIGMDGLDLSTQELRSFLRERLPDYMVPSAFVMIDTMPLTPNGKVDRKSLPQPDSFRPQLEAEYAPPSNEIERIIADVWQALLRLDKVGVHDNLFDLGGHSLLMVQIHRRLEALFKRTISIIEMFRYPTISSLAGYVGQGQTPSTFLEQANDRANTRKSMKQTQLRRRHSGPQDHARGYDE